MIVNDMISQPVLSPSKLNFKKKCQKEVTIQLSQSIQDCYGLGLEVLNKGLDMYIDEKDFKTCINSRQGNGKKIQMSAFPGYISENIARLAYQRRYGVSPNWNESPGDLTLQDQKFEVKGFSSHGPCSFGPKEHWDKLFLSEFSEEKFYRIQN
jgi:hypothetical protein